VWGLILAGPSLETRSRDAAPKPAKKVNIKSDTALPLIALDLAICLSIYHRVRSLLAGCVAGNAMVKEKVPKTHPKLGGHV